MPSYRGIDKADFMQTVTDAITMLETHSTGPEMQKRIDALRTPDANGQTKLGALAQAATDQDFVHAVRASGLDYLFSRTGEVLQYHAVNDTDGMGARILQELVKWNATGAAMTMEYNGLDNETDHWLVNQYARLAPVTQETLQKLDMIANAVSSNSVAVTHAFVAARDLVETAHNGASDASLAQIFDKLDPHERHIVKSSLTALFTLDGAQGQMSFQPAIRGFGVVIDGLAEGKINWTDKSIEDVRMKVEKALGPFYDLDEVTMTAIGLIGDYTRQNLPQGIVFTASARAAQAVADALPGMKVLDFEGNTVSPAQKPGPRKPALNP